MHDQAASGPGPLYELGILDEDEAMNKIPDFDNWYVNTSPTASRVNAIIDSTANQDDFATVHVSVNGHSTIAMIDTGADITIIDRSFARTLSIAHDKIEAVVVMAIGPQQIQRERTTVLSFRGSKEHKAFLLLVFPAAQSRTPRSTELLPLVVFTNRPKSTGLSL